MTRIGRRRALEKIGLAGAAVLGGASCNDGSPVSPSSDSAAAAATPAQCLLTPSLTEGPFYFDASHVRSDVTEGRPGTPLELTVTVQTASSCTPIADAVTDIWHCDAYGLYSGYASEGTRGEDFLRGIQVTDANGRARFSTIYPGWYAGRTIHVHLKIHLDARTVLTSQLYFPEEISDAVMAGSPYRSRGTRTTRNSNDGLFTASTLLNVSSAGSGYTAGIVIGVQS